MCMNTAHIERTSTTTVHGWTTALAGGTTVTSSSSSCLWRLTSWPCLASAFSSSSTIARVSTACTPLSRILLGPISRILFYLFWIANNVQLQCCPYFCRLKLAWTNCYGCIMNLFQCVVWRVTLSSLRPDMKLSLCWPKDLITALTFWYLSIHIWCSRCCWERLLCWKCWNFVTSMSISVDMRV